MYSFIIAPMPDSLALDGTSILRIAVCGLTRNSLPAKEKAVGMWTMEFIGIE
jgi:hypothetical protein